MAAGVGPVRRDEARSTPMQCRDAAIGPIHTVACTSPGTVGMRLHAYAGSQPGLPSCSCGPQLLLVPAAHSLMGS